MGGIIVIDFIDMKDPKKRAQIHAAIKSAMAVDRAKHTILPMSKFGLIQITRERVRPQMEISNQENCTTCGGTGKMDSSVQLIDKIENEVLYLWENMNQKSITLRANPLITAYFKTGFPSKRLSWYFKYKQWLNLHEDADLPLTGYHFENNQHQIIHNEA
jgi:ribonuclease G